jgi:hypothetical protein
MTLSDGEKVTEDDVFSMLLERLFSLSWKLSQSLLSSLLFYGLVDG